MNIGWIRVKITICEGALYTLQASMVRYYSIYITERKLRPVRLRKFCTTALWWNRALARGYDTKITHWAFTLPNVKATVHNAHAIHLFQEYTTMFDGSLLVVGL